MNCCILTTCACVHVYVQEFRASGHMMRRRLVDRRSVCYVSVLVLAACMPRSAATTTGNACFADGMRLCRGSNLGHSIKTLFVEGQPQEPSAKNGSRQRMAIGKEAFAEGTALGKDRPTANQIFTEGRGPRQRCPRQIRPVGSRRPFPVKLCRGPPVRSSAKVFFPVKPALI